MDSRIRRAVSFAGIALLLSSCVTTTVTVRREKPAIDWGATFEALAVEGVAIATLAQLFSFEAPVKGNAPIVLDYQLEGKGELLLDIWTENAKSSTTLRFPGKGGARKVVEEKLPAKLGKWQTASLLLTAADKSGKEIDFQLFGIGVGKRAVGSTSIYQITFQPDSIRSEETAAWGFRSKRDFEHAKVVFYRPTDTGHWAEEWSADSSCLPRRKKRCEESWDGSDGHGARSAGRHRIGIRAWLTSHGRDWITVMGEQEVEVS